MLYLAPWAVGSLAFLYKIWRIIKKDRKEDNLETFEKAYREEIKNDNKQLKDEIKTLKEENQKLHEELAELRASFNICKNNHPSVCPIFARLRREQANSEDRDEGS